MGIDLGMGRCDPWGWEGRCHCLVWGTAHVTCYIFLTSGRQSNPRFLSRGVFAILNLLLCSKLDEHIKTNIMEIEICLSLSAPALCPNVYMRAFMATFLGEQLR